MKTIASLAAAITAVLLAAPVSAQTFANGPYYATPSWDQSLPAGSRFLVLSNFNNEAVLDRETGLVWQRTLGPLRPAEDNDTACLTAKIGNKFGWRAPTLPEAGTLFDPTSGVLPGLPIGHPFLGFPTTGNNNVFNTSTFFTNGFRAAVFYFNNPGGVLSIGIGAAGGQGSTLCVRGSGIATPR